MGVDDWYKYVMTSDNKYNYVMILEFYTTTIN